MQTVWICGCLHGAGGNPLPRPLAAYHLQLRHSVRGSASRTVEDCNVVCLVGYCNESRRFKHSF